MKQPLLLTEEQEEERMKQRLEEFRVKLEALQKKTGLRLLAALEYHNPNGIQPVIKIVKQLKE